MQGSRFAPLPEIERRLRDRWDRRRRVPSWAASIDLVSALPLDSTLVDWRGAAAALEAAARMEGANGLRFRPSGRFRSGSPNWFVLSEDEFRALLPSPWTIFSDAVQSAKGPESQVSIGRSAAGANVAFPMEAHQGRHFALLGETGMGKSSLLIRIALRVASLGGVLLLDPIGDTGREFLSRLSPEVEHRVFWVSPTSSPLGLNALIGAAQGPPENPTELDRRIGDLVTGLRRVRAARYIDQPFWGPRIEEMLFRSLRAAAHYPDGSLEDAHQLLEAADRPAHGVPDAAREAVQELRQRVRDRPDELEGARRVLNEIVRSPALRSLLCRRNASWRASKIVAPGAIVVVTGDAPQVGELTSRYLLSVYLGLLWSEILARPAPRKLFVLLDEAQWFAHESLADLLRLGRRFNVHVGVATQAMRSLPESVRESIWTNCSDFVVFRGAPDEAREFGRWLPGLDLSELLSLPRGQALVFLGKGSSVHWLTTPPPPPITSRGWERFKSADRNSQFPQDLAAPTAPSGSTPVSSDAIEPRSADRKVYAMIAALIEHSGTTGEVCVPLDQLRTIDPTGAGVRRAGSALGRAQAIRSQHDELEGNSWWIHPERFRTAVAPPVSPEEVEWGRRQRNVEGDP